MRRRYWSSVSWLQYRQRTRYIKDLHGNRKRFTGGFWTLTVPGDQKVEHKEFKRRVLDPFWVWCRNVAGVRDFVWTAELQKRGAIHFHAIVNQYVDRAKVERQWVHLCVKSGAVDLSPRYANNATRLERIRHSRGVRSYAGEYIGKAFDVDEDIGHRWGGSHTVTGMEPLRMNELEHGDLVHEVYRQCRAIAGRRWCSLEGVEVLDIDPATLLADEGSYANAWLYRSACVDPPS